jgi:hypothetical protein
MKVLQWQHIFTFIKIVLGLKRSREEECIHENDAAIKLISPLKHFFL